MDTDYNPKKYDDKIKAYSDEDEKPKLDLSTLEEFDTIDGKQRDSNKLQAAKDLEELLGMKDVNLYGTLNRDIFSEKVEEMTLTDLQSLAMKIGFPPSRDRISLKAGLKKSFDLFLRKHGSGAYNQQEPIIDPSSPNYNSVVKLFRE